MTTDRIEIDVQRREGSIDVAVRSSLLTLVTALGREPASGAYFAPSELAQAAIDAGPYLMAHLHVEADGAILVPSLASARLDPSPEKPVHRRVDVENVFAVHRLRYQTHRGIAKLRLEHDMLSDITDTGGGHTSLDYLVELRVDGGPKSDHLLRPGLPIELDLGSAPTEGRARSEVFGAFVKLGATHILGGFDHLLFLAALVLSARSMRALVLTIVAFTLAHTTTLALATLGWVTISSRVVEPLIALSIVIAAASTLRPPSVGGERLRLGIAFGFGLVHGLGFAGGLSEALDGDRSALVLALVAFTLGVELIQQGLVVPLYWLIRRIRAHASGPRWLERAALAVVALGILFLIQSLKRGA